MTNGKSTLIAQARSVARGQQSPVDLLEETCETITRIQARLNAFTHIFEDEAFVRAKELASSAPAGPLRGVPIAIKELYDVAGAPTTGCCGAYMGRVATDDAAVVRRLREAGAIIVAKTNQHELACGGTGLVSSFGPVRNPWGDGRMPGGSSSGSGAAVGGGAVSFAMGSDSLGSIRHPSSWCGTTGLKTTYAAVSMQGAMPFIRSTDSAGPIAVSAEDCGLVHRVIADRAPPPPRPLHDLRVGIPDSFFTLCHPDVRARVEDSIAVFRDLGVNVQRVAGPSIDLSWAAVVMLLAEFGEEYQDLVGDDRVDPETAFLFGLPRAPLEDRRGTVDAARADWSRVMDEADVLLAPATPYAAPRVDATSIEVEGGELDARAGMARYSAPVNIAGFPALAFPVGFTPEGMPVGAQLIGTAHSEETLVALGSAYQRETDWHLRLPQ
ncbi:MAG: amidase [Actinobacteria bacterium]|nr:amidase [Actinomycetota bacterium]